MPSAVLCTPWFGWFDFRGLPCTPWFGWFDFRGLPVLGFVTLGTLPDPLDPSVVSLVCGVRFGLRGLGLGLTAPPLLPALVFLAFLTTAERLSSVLAA